MKGSAWAREKNVKNVLPPNSPEGLKLAVEKIDGNNEPGFLIYGAPVGSDTYCTHQLRKIAEGIVSDAQQTVELLAGERQSLWLNLLPAGWMINCGKF